jgi:predicted ABC-type ATPase
MVAGSLHITLMPELYIIGGANGSGKTTVALSLLPNFLEVFEYVNADALAKRRVSASLLDFLLSIQSQWLSNLDA